MPIHLDLAVVRSPKSVALACNWSQGWKDDLNGCV